MREVTHVTDDVLSKKMVGRNTEGLVALIGIRKNGNRTRVRFPSIAPTGIEPVFWP